MSIQIHHKIKKERSGFNFRLNMFVLFDRSPQNLMQNPNKSDMLISQLKPIKKKKGLNSNFRLLGRVRASQEAPPK